MLADAFQSSKTNTLVLASKPSTIRILKTPLFSGVFYCAIGAKPAYLIQKRVVWYV
jgi:hypothetical protein